MCFLKLINLIRITIMLINFLCEYASEFMFKV